MGHRSKRIAFIPVRGGSKSIPKKNIKKIAGKPLVWWVIDAALESCLFEDIYISTEDKEIAQEVRRHHHAEALAVVQRSTETATDTASTESAMLEFGRNHEFDIITLIQATSPLLTATDLEKGMKQFLEDEHADSLLSVCRQKRFIWEETEDGYVQPVNYDPQNRLRRQEFNGFLVENGAFYITRKDSLMKTGSRLSGHIICYEMSPKSYHELDEPSDWPIIETLLQNSRVKDLAAKLKKIKLFLTDVDGVLTDAGMYYTEKGDELKKFNTRDGKGLELLREKGLKVGIITSEDTNIVTDRAKKLKVELLKQGIKQKGELLKEIVAEYRLNKDQVAYIGDDVNDLSIIKEVGFSACPADAMYAIKSEVDYICEKKGGNGCVREISDIIISHL